MTFLKLIEFVHVWQAGLKICKFEKFVQVFTKPQATVAML